METIIPEGILSTTLLNTMFSTYLGALVGLVEVTSGLLLLTKRANTLEALLLLPITVNLVLFHSFRDVARLAPGLMCFIINLYMFYNGRLKLLPILAKSKRV